MIEKKIEDLIVALEANTQAHMQLAQALANGGTVDAAGTASAKGGKAAGGKGNKAAGGKGNKAAEETPAKDDDLDLGLDDGKSDDLDLGLDEEEEVPPMTLKDLKLLLGELFSTKGRETVLKLFKEHGVKTADEIKESDFNKVAEKARQLMKG